MLEATIALLWIGLLGTIAVMAYGFWDIVGRSPEDDHPEDEADEETPTAEFQRAA